MASGGFRFAEFHLDPDDRRLRREGAAVELSARYLDALVLLVTEAGRLVTKDRFMDEVWRGVPVTDEALTQCIRTLRRQLGDDAARPSFIETVPKHGYRFIAVVEVVDGEAASEALPLDGGDERIAMSPGHGFGSRGDPNPLMGGGGVVTRAEPDERVHPTPNPSPPRGGERIADSLQPWRRHLLLGGAGVLGAGVAGLVGGIAYGLAASSQPGGPGAVSVLLVLLSLTLFAALIGGAGVCLGIAAAGLASGRLGPSSVAGGALGGLIVGALAKLLGLDAFNLLLGRAPGDITGAAEGALIGAAVGIGVWLGAGMRSVRRGASLAAAVGAATGLVIALLGGRLMAGSLDLLAREFPGSRLRVDALGALFGESALGPVSLAITGALEVALFTGCVVAAILLARRSLDRAG